MSVTQQQVLDSLRRVRSPRGVALNEANVLSDITVNDGKVSSAPATISITVNPTVTSMTLGASVEPSW